MFYGTVNVLPHLGLHIGKERRIEVVFCDAELGQGENYTFGRAFQLTLLLTPREGDELVSELQHAAKVVRKRTQDGSNVPDES